MNMIVQGEITDHRDVDSELIVQGALHAGATVRDGGNLVVQGHVSGPLVIERGGIGSVQGNIDGEVYLREGGTLLVTGNWAASLRDRAGRFGVAVGSILDGKVVTDDGSLRDPVDSESLNIVNSVENYRFLNSEGRFVGLESLANNNAGA
jgi:hypothetical protein